MQICIHRNKKDKPRTDVSLPLGYKMKTKNLNFFIYIYYIYMDIYIKKFFGISKGSI